MGVQALLDYIQKNFPDECVNVDLMQIASQKHQKKRSRPLRLVVDAENCLQRLYGGSYTDWVCGGQWNHMCRFMEAFVKACHTAKIDLIVFFNGSMERQRMAEWFQSQDNARHTFTSVIRHVNNKGTPPPKVLWVPPAGLSTALRLALRYHAELGTVSLRSTFNEHRVEIMSFCRQYKCAGIVGQNSEYLLFNPAKMYSASCLTLARNHQTLMTTEYRMQEICDKLGVTAEKLELFATLLGNHILPDEDLVRFHWSLINPGKMPEIKSQTLNSPDFESVMKAVSKYIQTIDNILDLEALSTEIFRYSKTNTEEKIARFKESIAYFRRGRGWRKCLQIETQIEKDVEKKKCDETPSASTNQDETAEKDQSDSEDDTAVEEIGEQISEDTQREMDEALEKELQQCLNKNLDNMRNIMITDNEAGGDSSLKQTEAEPDPGIEADTLGAGDNLVTTTQDDGKNGNTTAVNADDSGVVISPSKVTDELIPSLLDTPKQMCMQVSTPKLPPLPPAILRVAQHRHALGLMMPEICHILREGSVKIPATIEDEHCIDIPPTSVLFRPIRQRVYGILFDAKYLPPAQKDPATGNLVGGVIIKEWCSGKGSSLHKPHLVNALPLNWEVPSIHHLWLGHNMEDYNLRIHTFLSCMGSFTPTMLKVPAHKMILCSVLRYMLQFNGPPILRRQELDAFLAQSISPRLNDPKGLQEIQIPLVTNRGIQLAALFMRGVETALLANDACGAPIPWDESSPWQYFDGKLFHTKLLKANSHRSAIDLCDGRLDLVSQMEFLRNSILEGLVNQHFISPNLVRGGYDLAHSSQQHHSLGNVMPAGVSMMTGPRPPMYHADKGKRFVSGRGGRLDIAGVTVAQWDGNKMGRGHGVLAPQVTSVGGGNKSRGVVSSAAKPIYGRGRAGRMAYMANYTQSQSYPPSAGHYQSFGVHPWAPYDSSDYYYNTPQQYMYGGGMNSRGGGGMALYNNRRRKPKSTYNKKSSSTTTKTTDEVVARVTTAQEEENGTAAEENDNGRGHVKIMSRGRGRGTLVDTDEGEAVGMQQYLDSSIPTTEEPDSATSSSESSSDNNNNNNNNNNDDDDEEDDENETK